MDTPAWLGRRGEGVGVKTDHMEPSPAGQQSLDTHTLVTITTPQIFFIPVEISPAVAGSVTV